MGKILHVPAIRWGFLRGVVVLLLGSVSLFYFQFVKVKMLPFDNKSEFQVIVDMPNGTTLEETARAANALARATLDQPQVVNLETYVGTASPFNFNGLVRHYYLRQGSNVADIQVNLLPKGERKLQSHEIAKQVRQRLLPVAARYGARIKVAEVPPGPPVLETLVAEVYGPELNERTAIARRIRDLWKRTNGVVDVDWYVEDDQPKYQLLVDKEKAALNGISEDDIAQTMALASSGYQAGLLHADSSKEDVPLTLRLDRATRSDLEKIQTLKVAGRTGRLVALSELVRSQEVVADKSIYHKNLLPVTYVTGDVAGAMESPVYAILKLGPEMDKFQAPGGYAIEQHMAALPTDAEHYSMKWDGEWHITYEVFRDLGIAFAAVLILIYGLVVGWFQSFITPLVIMAAIPFSLVGILPAHGLLHAFFTATSMIGFIAGAGIVVRNSIILVDFIELRLQEGMPLDASGDRRRSGPLPSHDVDRGSRGGRRRRDPVRSHLSGSRHRADGRRSRFAGAVAHDGAHCLLCCESKEKNRMTIERYLRLIAGFFVMLSVALGYWVNPAWFLFTAFVGLNLFQSAFTNWCPMMFFLAETGRPAGGELRPRRRA